MFSRFKAVLMPGDRLFHVGWDKLRSSVCHHLAENNAPSFNRVGNAPRVEVRLVFKRKRAASQSDAAPGDTHQTITNSTA
ncbi:MAG: hypothetical protein DWH84_04165 [Planctomycetota bacterium]|nr:MAG: hypothetical protein DWH84_04165 [Planctomycetota bacterium]